MPPKAKETLAADTDDRKKAKAGHARTALVPGKRLVRNKLPVHEAQKIIGFDPTYQICVAGRIGGALGNYMLEEKVENKTIYFDVRRLSDYDTPKDGLHVDGKLKGRRPIKKIKEDFVEITTKLKDDAGKTEKWCDTEAPLLDADKFEYKRPTEVFKVNRATLPFHSSQLPAPNLTVPLQEGQEVTFFSPSPDKTSAPMDPRDVVQVRSILYI